MDCDTPFTLCSSVSFLCVEDEEKAELNYLISRAEKNTFLKIKLG